MPDDIRIAAGESVQEIRELFLNPEIVDVYDVKFRQPDVDAVVRFLCEDREFSVERVRLALERAFGGQRELL